jgi:hypothetical protein
VVNDLLAEELSRSAESQVAKVETHLRGRKVARREQLQAVFCEPEQRIAPRLDRGSRAGLRRPIPSRLAIMANHG